MSQLYLHVAEEVFSIAHTRKWTNGDELHVALHFKNSKIIFLNLKKN
jgi:hypothetical protein